MPATPPLLPDPPNLTIATLFYEIRSEQSVFVFDPGGALPSTSMASMGDLKHEAYSLILVLDVDLLQ